MGGSKHLLLIGLADFAVLDEELLRVLWEVSGQKNAEGWSTVVLQWRWIILRLSKPCQVPTVESIVFLVVWSLLIMCNGALSASMRKEMESWLPVPRRLDGKGGVAVE